MVTQQQHQRSSLMPSTLPSFQNVNATTSPTTATANRLFSFWNTCGDSIQRTHNCTTSSVNCTSFDETTIPSSEISNVTNECNYYENELDYDDKDSIVEQPTWPHHRTSTPTKFTTQQRVRKMVDGLFTPILQCVQPPIQSCITPVHEEQPWVDPRFNSNHVVREMQLPPGDHRQHSKQHQKGMIYRRNDGSGKKGKIQDTSNTTNKKGENYNALDTSRIAASTSNTSTNGIGINDVLCGRGNGVNQHQGNVHFRQLIHANHNQYHLLTKKEKIVLAQSIVNMILYHTNPPGRFIAKNTETGLWYDVGMARSIEKTSQVLREMSNVTPNTRDNANIKSVVSFDERENDAALDDIATATKTVDADNEQALEQQKRTAETLFSRASTIKISNNNKNNDRNGRGILLSLPSIVIPNHLSTIYHKDAVIPYQTDHEEEKAIAPQQFSNAANQQQPYTHYFELQHPLRQGRDEPLYSAQYSQMSRPYHINDRSNYRDIMISPASPLLTSLQAPTNTVSILKYSPTRSCSQLKQQQHAPVSDTILVTPIGKQKENCIHRCSSIDSPMLTATAHLINPCASWDHVQEQTSPVFPFDRFHNQEDQNHENSTAHIEYQWKESFVTNGVDDNQGKNGKVPTISPSREQLYTKRQRTSKTLLDNSLDSIEFIDVDTSLEESIEATFESVNKNTDDGTTIVQTMSTAPTTIINNTTTHRLVEAIGTQLTLDDDNSSTKEKIVRGSVIRRRRLRSNNNSDLPQSIPCLPVLPRPPKVTAPLDISADSIEDGLAALSTTAFLRLDESF